MARISLLHIERRVLLLIILQELVHRLVVDCFQGPSGAEKLGVGCGVSSVPRHFHNPGDADSDAETRGDPLKNPLRAPLTNGPVPHLEIPLKVSVEEVGVVAIGHAGRQLVVVAGEEV